MTWLIELQKLSASGGRERYAAQSSTGTETRN
jgi:hypothetical protein